MRTRNRWMTWCWSAGLALVLVGRAAGQPAAKPASLDEATRVIDLRKFPLPDDGKDLYNSADVPKGDIGKDLRKTACELGFHLRNVNGAEVTQFCRNKLADAGWKVAEAKREVIAKDSDYFTFTASRQGFVLSGSVYASRETGGTSVTLTNHGNIDSRSLPRVAGAELKDNDFNRTIYLTDAKEDDVLEFARTELKKAGWREVRMMGGKIDRDRRFPVYLRFIQRGVEISVRVQAKDGKTDVWNSARLLDVELPIMPDAKGNVEFIGYAHYVHLFYAAPTGPEKVLEFYRKELPALGWTIRAGTDSITNGKAKVILEAPEQNPLRLELLATKDDTLVLITKLPQEKPVTPKSAVKGSLRMGDTTFQLTSAFAYETMRSNRKETVVILSDKPLDTTKLKQALQKNGSDADFFPTGAYVKLRFDEKGAIAQTAIYADGATLIGNDNGNIKVTATVKEGIAKGRSGSEKPGEFFKKSYQFEVTFEVAVLQLPGSTAITPVDPKINPTPVDPKPAVVTEKELRFDGKLSEDDPKVMDKPAKIHAVKMSPNKTYIIDMESREFDAYLRILDAGGKQLAYDDDGGEGLNSRLRFTPPREGDYQIVATSFGPGKGSYLLKVRVAQEAPVDPKAKPAPLVATEKESSVEGKLANDSPMIMGKPAQVHTVKMSGDKTYLIDLESTAFDAYLRILDANGKQLAFNDDGGDKRNARLRFTPPRDGDYQIVATRFGGGQGSYVLKIRVLKAGE